MAFATPSDSLLRISLVSGLAVFLLTLLLLAAIAILRYLSDYYRRKQQALSERWQPVFMHVVEGLPVAVPDIAQREMDTVLYLWIHFTESLRGTARDRLRSFAYRIGLDKTAMILLDARRERQQMMGIVTLGRMQMRAAWQAIAMRLEQPNPMLSLLAARSLLQINPASAMPLVLQSVARHDDWPASKVLSMFRASPPKTLAKPLMDAIAASPAAGKTRLIRLLEVLPSTDTWVMLEPLLAESQSIEVIAASLKMCRDPRALETVRQLATHPNWIVRAQAATTLGAIGVGEDRYRLLAMLGDPEWWVRYRAGMSLPLMPGISREKLQAMLGLLTDRFAIDTLGQVISEAYGGA